MTSTHEKQNSLDPVRAEPLRQAQDRLVEAFVVRHRSFDKLRTNGLEAFLRERRAPAGAWDALKGNAYAFVFDQQGLMASLSIEGTKISHIKR